GGFNQPSYGGGIPDEARTYIYNSYLYQHDYVCVLQNKSKLPFFLVVVDGTGYLMEHKQWAQTQRKLRDKTTIRRLVDECMSWTTFTEGKAYDLCGYPNRYEARQRILDFVSFEAFSHFQEERNLYHIDLVFDGDRYPIRYRIRGIGISNP